MIAVESIELSFRILFFMLSKFQCREYSALVSRELPVSFWSHRKNVVSLFMSVESTKTDKSPGPLERQALDQIA